MCSGVEGRETVFVSAQDGEHKAQLPFLQAVEIYQNRIAGYGGIDH